MRLAFQGLALFAFIPLVLFLYLRQPLGPALSILVGLAIMFGHRFVASPWMARHAVERCLWCGRAIPGKADVSPYRNDGLPAETLPYRAELFPVMTGGREVTMAACRPAHHALAARFFTFLARWRPLIGIGIFVPLLLLIAGSLALAIGRQFLPHEWNTWQFKVIVAFTVVATSIAYRFGAVKMPLRSPFPLHNLFLLGIRNTLWVFRFVGTWWLIAGVLQVLQR